MAAWPSWNMLKPDNLVALSIIYADAVQVARGKPHNMPDAVCWFGLPFWMPTGRGSSGKQFLCDASETFQMSKAASAHMLLPWYHVCPANVVPTLHSMHEQRPPASQRSRAALQQQAMRYMANGQLPAQQPMYCRSLCISCTRHMWWSVEWLARVPNMQHSWAPQ